MSARKNGIFSLVLAGNTRTSVGSAAESDQKLTEHNKTVHPDSSGWTVFVVMNFREDAALNYFLNAGHIL